MLSFRCRKDLLWRMASAVSDGRGVGSGCCDLVVSDLINGDGDSRWSLLIGKIGERVVPLEIGASEGGGYEQLGLGLGLTLYTRSLKVILHIDTISRSFSSFFQFRSIIYHSNPPFENPSNQFRNLTNQPLPPQIIFNFNQLFKK